MKNRLLKILPSVALSATTATTCLTGITSCSNNNLENQLKSLNNVSKVEKLEDMPGFESRYLVTFNHPLNWENKSEGTFLQKVEINFRGYDRVNQFFTCGYELRKFRPNRMNDFEVANRYLGNIIKPEFRFYGDSQPVGLTYNDVDGWKHLTNKNAMEDFHSMITAFKTILKGKWVFSGTSKGGETTNMYAMTYPKDCDAYIPYVAPALYARDCTTFTDNIYNTIGIEVLGETICKEYRDEISKFQWYLLENKDDFIERIWQLGVSTNQVFTKYIQEHHEYLFDLCVTDFACGFWQYDQDIKSLRDVNDETDVTKKKEKAFSLLTSVSGPSGYSKNCLFFPYFYQGCREMGEQKVDFSQMIQALATYKSKTVEEVSPMIKVPTEDRPYFYWKVLFDEDQYKAWYNNGTVAQDMTMANGLQKWNNTCTVPVFMIFGGADTWYHLRLPDSGTAPGIRRYVGKDPVNASGRTHMTRISTLSESQQKEIWAQLDEILAKK